MDNQNHDNEEFNYEVSSITELAMKWFWIGLCALMWIGVVLSIFTADPLGILGGAVVAGIVTLWLRWLFKRKFPKY